MKTRFEKLLDNTAAWLNSHSAFFPALLFLCLLPVFATINTADPDLFARVAAGRLIALQSAVPLADPFAYTPTNPVWYDHEWLSGYLLYLLSQAGGDWAFLLCKCYFAYLTIVLLASAQAADEGNHETCPYRLPVLAFAAVYSAQIWNSTIRSQVFTWLFVPLLLLLLKRYAATAAWRFLLPLPILFALWANLHGGFLLGLALLAVFCAGALPRGPKIWGPALVALISACLAALINPYGPGYLQYVVGAVLMNRPGISEWHMLPIYSVEAILFDLFLILVAAALFLRVRFTFMELALLAFSIAPGLRHQRLAPLFPMICAVFCTKQCGIVIARMTALFPEFVAAIRRSATFVLGLWVLCGGFAVVMLFLSLPAYSLDYAGYPVKAAEWLRTHRQGGRLLVHFNMGSYALWRLYPYFQISLDGRYEELYSQETYDTVCAAFDVRSPRFKSALEEVRGDFILLSTDSFEWRERWRYGDEWKVIYEDSEFGLLEDCRAAIPEVEGRERVGIWTPLF